jgi:hypothetical protein
MIGDHFEPKRDDARPDVALSRVEIWRRKWPEIAARHPDSMGHPASYTFFYPEEEYEPGLIEPLAEMTRAGIGDVEIHIHHDGEGQQNFVDRMSSFTESLRRRHGLLHEEGGRVRFGFIHGNWALDNSLRDGRWCGLNNEIQLLRDLGCYADFTLPSAPSSAQTSMVNSIYWATDDPTRPKSHDKGVPITEPGSSGDLLMIQGPLALNWTERSAKVMPRLDAGDLGFHYPVTACRVNLWLRFAPRIGNNIFVKLYAHGALESHANWLLGGDLDRLFTLLKEACVRRNLRYRFVSAWQMYNAVLAAAHAGAGLGEMVA